MNTVIGHLDADCFYVSCERVRFPCLRRLPVGVLGNQGVFVIAKSYELKRLGVPTGMAVKEAAAICPEAIFVKRDFRWYEEVSRRMLGCVATVSPRVEFYSIDECFFDASLLPRMLLKNEKPIAPNAKRNGRCGLSCGNSLFK